MIDIVVGILLIMALVQVNILLWRKGVHKAAEDVVEGVREHLIPGKAEVSKYEKILRNIDVYDGTDRGQIDVEG